MNQGKKISVLSKIALVLATVIWGSSFFMMKNTLDNIGAFYLLAIRFTIASALLALIFLPKLKLINKEYLLGGALFGLLLTLAYVLQTIGLRYTTPGKNAFLTAVYCLLVPFLYWGISGKKPDAYNITAAVVCVAGIGLVSINPSTEAMFNRGDLLTLAGGFMYACHIVAVKKIGADKDIILLTILQFVFSAIFCWIGGALFEEFPSSLGAGTKVSLMYLGVMCTAAALLLQNVGQKYTPPSTAALLLSLEAVFGVIFSVIFADEPLSAQLVFGFILIFSALVISEAKPKLPKFSSFTSKQKGIVYIISAAFFFALMNTFVRLAGDLPSIQKSFFRNVVAAVFSACILLRSKEKFRFDKKNLPYLICRAVFGTIGIFGNFYAIDHLLLSDSSMLNKLSPFFAIIFSYFILKEKITLKEAAALLAAIFGCVLIIKPGTSMFAGTAGIVAIIGAMGAGMAYTMVRVLSKRGERGAFIVFFFSAFSCLVTIPFIIVNHAPMSLYQVGMLLCAGLAACGGQFSVTAAYSNAPAKEISVYDYTQVIFAAIMGFFIFDQLPDVYSVLGYIIIIGVAVIRARGAVKQQN